MEAETIRLYYYTGKRWGMKALWEKRLKVAQYKDVNDPFELIPFDRTKKRSREFYDRRVKKLFASRYGVICFSEDWRTTLMWSHYGEKHSGICLGFDVPLRLAEPIAYVETPLDDPVDHKKQLKRMSASVFEAALSSKYNGWRYERERRLRVRLDDPIDGIFYRPFDDTCHLREVILGASCTLNPAEVVEAVSNPPLDVEIFKARVAHDRFEVCRHEVVETRNVSGFRARLAAASDLYSDQLPDEPDTPSGQHLGSGARRLHRPT